jgi:hypothetical protein
VIKPGEKGGSKRGQAGEAKRQDAQVGQETSGQEDERQEMMDASNHPRDNNVNCKLFFPAVIYSSSPLLDTARLGILCDWALSVQTF